LDAALPLFVGDDMRHRTGTSVDPPSTHASRTLGDLVQRARETVVMDTSGVHAEVSSGDEAAGGAASTSEANANATTTTSAADKKQQSPASLYELCIVLFLSLSITFLKYFDPFFY